MLQRTLCRWKPKTLPQMFRKLKLAGAHPDVLWGIDAQKAQHNGEEMIRLETLMHQREASVRGEGASGSTGATPALSNEPQKFLFWLRAAGEQRSNAAAAAARLRAVSCTVTPLSDSRVVKRQLSQLFEDAGILEDFEVGGGSVEVNLGSVLRHADERQSEHLHQSGSLYIRGDKAVENLRRAGVLLVVEEEGVSYLVTLPETGVNGQDSNNARERIGGGRPPPAQSGSGAAPYMPAKSIIGPNGEIDSDVQDFMTERGLRPFDLRMAGSHSSVERFVGAFERLERMYEVHRGRALRPSVCIVLSLKARECYIAPDGCLVLAVQSMPAWEEFLLSLPQAVWQDCVAKHTDWRIGSAPKLQERRRKLRRVADMFHFFRVTMEAPVGGRLQWQDELLARFSKEETMIRRAVLRYHLQSDRLKKRGELCFVDHLYSSTIGAGAGSGSGGKEIGYRICGDGSVYFSHSVMNTGQVLRVLKDNLRRIETFQEQHEAVVKTLEHLSRSVPVDFSVDTKWKLSEEGNLVNCLERFARTIRQNERQLAAFLQSLLAGGGAGGGGGPNAAPPIPAGLPVKRRMVWVISNRFETMPSGVVFVPYDVDFESIQQLLLGPR